HRARLIAESIPAGSITACRQSLSTLLSTFFDVRRRVSQSQRAYAVDYRCQASRTPLGETVKPAITRKACTGLLDIVNCESASYRRPIRRTSKVKSAVDF